MKIVKTPTVFVEMTPNALDALTSNLSEILRGGTAVIAEHKRKSSFANQALKSLGQSAKERKQELKEIYRDIAYAAEKIKTLAEVQRQLKRAKSKR